METSEPLGRRLRRLEDIEAIRRLKYRYCEACDDGYDADRIAALFLPDAVWDGGPMGRYEGREAIRAFFINAGQAVAFALHHVTNPIIDVEGDAGSACWMLWEPIVYTIDDTAYWMAATYHDRCRRVGGEWLFSSMRVELRMLSPYDEGFARNRVRPLSG